MLYVINLINGKFRTKDKFDQVIKNILSNNKYADKNIYFNMDFSNDFNNHWLTGFSDADASFQIKIIKRVTRPKPEIRLNFKIDQKNNLLLNMI
jgi:hypothetical protein